ncbi:MAG: hypothetical protein JW768_14570 [Chitinispirillaceae bacterium]|nr:hypothetical protein [Chitinispirillaceae bacterium]
MNRGTAVRCSIFYGVLFMAASTAFYCASPGKFTQKTSYDKAEVLADSLAKTNVQRRRQGKDGDECRKILDSYRQLSTLRDALEREIEDVREKNTDLRSAARKQIRQLDSLSRIINTQKEALEKLQELDIKQEQQRRKIQ